MDSSIPNLNSTARKQSDDLLSSSFPSPHFPTAAPLISTYQEALQAWQEVVSFDLNVLTARERAKALEDIHCVGGEEHVEESSTRIALLLDEFDRVAREEQNPIYEMASNNNTHVTDPTFRLRFLKHNSFNVRESVRQMMIYLQYKAAYLGGDKVAQHELALNDYLNDEDKRVLQSGLFHILKERDQAGRLVVHIMTHMLGNWSVETVIRVAHRIWSSVLIADSTAHSRGVVIVLYHCSSTQHTIPDSDFIVTILNALLSFPIRYSAMHVCLKTDEVGKGTLATRRQPFTEAIGLLPRYTRVRTRIHLATKDAELQRNLQSHGVSTESLPIDEDGNPRMDILNNWIFKLQNGAAACFPLMQDSGSAGSASKQQVKRPSTHSSSSENDSDGTDFMTVFDSDFQGIKQPPSHITNEGKDLSDLLDAKQEKVPTQTDVLLGRGWRLQNHEGNVRFRNFLEGFADAYDRSPRLEKRKMTRNLVESMQQQGTRFLKQSSENGERWIDSTMTEAENKVSQVFRTIRKTRQGKKRKAI